MKQDIRTKKAIVASSLVALSLLVSCGGDADRATTKPDGPLASDGTSAQVLVVSRERARAEQLEREAKLEGQARTYGTTAETVDATTDYVPASRHMPTR